MIHNDKDDYLLTLDVVGVETFIGMWRGHSHMGYDITEYLLKKILTFNILIKEPVLVKLIKE